MRPGRRLVSAPIVAAAAALMLTLESSCSSSSERPAPGGSSTSTTAGGAPPPDSGGPAQLPSFRGGGCTWVLDANAGPTRPLKTSAGAAALCTTDGRAKLSWSETSGSPEKTITVALVLQRDLGANAPETIPITEATITLVDGTKTAIWKTPTNACSLALNAREFFGTQASPKDFRYVANITCLEFAAPSNADAQPDSVKVDQLTVSTVLVN